MIAFNIISIDQIQNIIFNFRLLVLPPSQYHQIVFISRFKIVWSQIVVRGDHRDDDLNIINSTML